MNSFEIALCKATKYEFHKYNYLTGYWLLHAPEHFLQIVAGMHLGKIWVVHPEGSRDKITFETGKSPRGRPPNSTIRHDLVVWKKSQPPRLRAVVEVKRTNVCWHLKKDAKRIKNAAKKSIAGYLLVYSEVRYVRGKQILLKRFQDWANKLDLKIVGPESSQQILGKEKDDWIAGFCLMRAKKRPRNAPSTPRSARR